MKFSVLVTDVDSSELEELAQTLEAFDLSRSVRAQYVPERPASTVGVQTERPTPRYVYPERAGILSSLDDSTPFTPNVPPSVGELKREALQREKELRTKTTEPFPGGADYAPRRRDGRTGRY